MKPIKPPKTTLWLWIARTAVLAVLLLSAVFYLTDGVLFYGLFAVVTFITLFLCMVYYPLFFKYFSVELGEHSITVKSGVIIRKETVMPHTRTVYLREVSLPADRVFSLSALLLHAARGVCIIFELKDEDIKRIKDAMQ